MKITLFLAAVGLSCCLGANIISTRGERKLADADFLKKQQQVLDLFLDVLHPHEVDANDHQYNFEEHYADFKKEDVVKDFVHHYKHGFLPKDAVFTMFCHHTMKDTIRLFDLFYFAKDFETFHKVALWAKHHINPMQFSIAYALALFHREDCYGFQLPPLYEVFPSYFVPADTMHQVFDAKMLGQKTGRFVFNNTGYEYNYHSSMFGGPLSPDAVHYLDYKISYFREDVGLNSWFASNFLRFPSWMCPEKYRGTNWYKRGESFYSFIQQLFARYTLERLGNEMPYVEPLVWEEPIKVGYNPRITHFNGVPFYTRPDNVVPKEFNRLSVAKVQMLEDRIMNVIDAGAVWEIANKTLLHLDNEEFGVDMLGKIVYGTTDRPSRKFYGQYYWQAMEALGYLVKTSNEHSYVGGATTCPATALRDPVYYQFLNRVIQGFEHFKHNHFHHYTHKDLFYPGVKVENFEVDKLLTYFEMFDFEVTNAVPFNDDKEYHDHKYFASQYRLNHKPYNYKVTVKSEAAGDAMVRVFIGPKYDAEEHVLTLEQRRQAFVEIDRFPVKLAAGENVYERSSKESPVFSPDHEGFRHLYNRVENAIKNNEPFYINERYSCGAPSRFQLPLGWKQGQPYVISVVVTPYEPAFTGDAKQFYARCGSPKLYDTKPFGFPFDRHVEEAEFHHVPNIYFKDVLIYHKEESDVNRVQQ